MSLREKGYKVVSASAAAVETVAKPAVKHTHKIMLEGSRQIHSGIEDFIDTMDESSNKKMSWVSCNQFFKGLKKINKGVQNLVRYSISANYQDTASSLSMIENGLTSQQKDLEEYFEKNNKDVHRSWAFSLENRESIRELISYVRESTHEFDNVPYHRLLQYFIAFGKLQKMARRTIWSIQKFPMDETLYTGLKEMNDYCKYAVGIYGKLLVRIIIEKKWSRLFKFESDEEILIKYSGMKRENLIYSYIKSKKYMPAYAIVVDPDKKALILIVRGTMSVFDCITDMKGDYTTHDYTDPFTGEIIASGLVHSGILTCAKNLFEEVKPRLMIALDKLPDYKLVVAGHSLGAGASALLSLIWMSDPDIMTRGFLGLAYAPPAVVSAELNVHLKKYLFSCSFGNDIVCRLSFGAVKDFCNMVTFFHSRERDRTGVKASEVACKVLYGGKMESSRGNMLYKEVKDTFTNYKLEAPGNIFQIYQVKKHPDFVLIDEETKDDYIGEYVDPKFYEEIVFSKTTFTDHMPNFYEESLEYLVKKLEEKRLLEINSS